MVRRRHDRRLDVGLVARRAGARVPRGRSRRRARAALRGTLGGQALDARAHRAARSRPALLAGAVLPSATVSFKLSAAGDRDRRPGRPARDVGGRRLRGDAGPPERSRSSTPPATSPDGSYTLRVSARDAIGRSARAAAPLTVSRALVSFSADTKVVSPNGDGRRDTVTFRFALAQPAVATLSLVGAGGDLPALLGPAGAGPAVVHVHGHGRRRVAGSRRPVPGDDRRSARSSSSLPLTIDNTAPVVTLVSAGAAAAPRLRAGDRDRDRERQADQGEQEGGRVPAGEGRDGHDAERRRAGRGGQRVAAGHVSGETEALTQRS